MPLLRVVAQCGFAASDQRSAFSAQLGLVAQAFLPVWFWVPKLINHTGRNACTTKSLFLCQRGADDRFSSSALPRADHQRRWSAPRSSEAATKPAPHYCDTVFAA